MAMTRKFNKKAYIKVTLGPLTKKELSKLSSGVRRSCKGARVTKSKTGKGYFVWIPKSCGK